MNTNSTRDSSNSNANTPVPTDRWLDAVLTLRSDVRFDLRSVGGTEVVVIEDPVRSKFFQIGSLEYEFVSRIDGTLTGTEILQQLNRMSQNESVHDNDFAKAIMIWLVQNNLATTPTFDFDKRLNRQSNQLRRSKLVGLLNPISFKFKLWNPNRTLTWIQPYTGWIFSRVFLAIWIGMAIYSASVLCANWDRLGDASTGILSGSKWIWLLLTWAALKIVHESAHGIACRRYGGEVPEAGVLFLLFTPMAYVNVTSMWRFANRWQRMVVAIAGMFAELFVSFAAVIVWSQSTGLVSEIAFNVFFMSSVTTLLFNANPLMRFDGYYLLSDLLSIPNLYSKGTMWFGDRLKSLVLGTPKKANICRDHELRRVAVYGSLAFFWKLSISLSLIIGAGVLFHGAGIILSVAGVAIWFGIPMYHQIRTVWGPNARQPMSLRRAILSTIVFGVFGFIFFSVLSSPATKSAPAIVQFSNETVIRARIAGFINEILVNDGEQVQRGQPLMVLDNPELKNEVVELERLAAEAKIQARIHRQAREFSLSQTETSKHDELIEQLTEKREQADGLVVLAPFSGFVFRRSLANQRGSFAEQGDPLVTIANRQTKEVVVSIDQRDLESILQKQGDVMRVAFPGVRTLSTAMTRVEPRISQTPFHPSLCANNGGPLLVRMHKASDNDGGAEFEFLTPRFNVVLELDEKNSRPLQSGQRGNAFFTTRRQSLGCYLYLASCDWLRAKIETATHSAAF